MYADLIKDYKILVLSHLLDLLVLLDQEDLRILIFYSVTDTVTPTIEFLI